MTEILSGRNPVREALRGSRPLNKIMLAPNLQGRVISDIISLARSQGIPVQKVDRPYLDKVAGPGHQGVVALVAAKGYVEIEDLLNAVRDKQEPPFLILLDQVQDPHNLGSILRSAEAAGAHGVIVPRRRTAGLPAAVARTAAGALGYVPVARVTNLSRIIEKLKEEGIWVIGTDSRGEKEAFVADFTVPLALVMGVKAKGCLPLLNLSVIFAYIYPCAARLIL